MFPKRILVTIVIYLLGLYLSIVERFILVGVLKVRFVRCTKCKWAKNAELFSGDVQLDNQ